MSGKDLAARAIHHGCPAATAAGHKKCPRTEVPRASLAQALTAWLVHTYIVSFEALCFLWWWCMLLLLFVGAAEAAAAGLEVAFCA
jgi:hypothetical protein